VKALVARRTIRRGHGVEFERVAQSVSSAAERRHTGTVQVVGQRHPTGAAVSGQDELDIVRRQHGRLRGRQKGHTHTVVRH